MRINSIATKSNNYRQHNNTKMNNKSSNFCARGIYPGSFDPITLGHMDIIKRSSKLFDSLTVLVAVNPEKKGFLPIAQRIELIKKSVTPMKNVDVASSNGLTIDFARTR